MRDEYSIQLDLPVQQIQSYCETLPIQRLALFGSVLRNDFASDSDIDVLVDYLPDATVTLLDMASQEMMFSQIMQRKVDLRTANELSPYFRQEVIDHAQVIYERE